MKKLILGGVLGGAVVFAWGMVSWMVLPWHQWTFENFQNEALVQEALMASVSKAGIYLLPGCPLKGKNLPREEAKALTKEVHAKMETGPVAFVAIQPKGTGPMSILMVKGFVIQAVGAFLLAWLLSVAKLKGYKEKVVFSAVIALAAGVITLLPQWNWWGFSPLYTLVGIADLVIGWVLAALVIAKVAS